MNEDHLCMFCNNDIEPFTFFCSDNCRRQAIKAGWWA